MRARRQSPEDWESHLQQGLEALALLLYERSNCAVDSNGNMPLDPNYVRSRLVPWLAVRLPSLRSAVASLVRAGLFIVYEIDGVEFLHRVGFAEQGGSRSVEWPTPPLSAAAPLLTSDEVGPYHADGVTLRSRAVARLAADRGFLGAPGKHSGAGEPSGTRGTLDMDVLKTPGRGELPVNRVKGNGHQDCDAAEGDLVAPVAAALVEWNEIAPERLKVTTAFTSERLAKELKRRAGHLLHYDDLQPARVHRLLLPWLRGKLLMRTVPLPQEVNTYVARSFAMWVVEHALDVKEGRAGAVLSMAGSGRRPPTEVKVRR